MNDNRDVVINSQKGLYDPREAVGRVIDDYLIDSYDTRNLYHATDNFFRACEVSLCWSSRSGSFYVIPMRCLPFSYTNGDDDIGFGREDFTNELSLEEKCGYINA